MSTALYRWFESELRAFLAQHDETVPSGRRPKAPVEPKRGFPIWAPAS